jgi:hypothetical protein
MANFTAQQPAAAEERQLFTKSPQKDYNNSLAFVVGAR